MTEGFHRRSFASGGGLVRTLPSLSTVELNAEVYTTKEDVLLFSYYGIIEEFNHARQCEVGHMRNIRALERDSAAALTALINAQDNIIETKRRIVQNEIACEHIYSSCKPLVESMDKYIAFHKIKDAESELIAENQPIDRIGSRIGAKEVAKLEPEMRDLYEKFAMLGEAFDTWAVPWVAGSIALDIPNMFDPQIPLIQQTEQILDVDFKERFEIIYETLMNQNDQYPDLTLEDFQNVNKKAILFLGNLISELEFGLGSSQPDQMQLPLLDIPRRHSPSSDEIEQKIQQIENEFQEKLTGNNLLLHRILSDIGRFFTEYGCVIFYHEDLNSNIYVPNGYLLKKEIGRDFFRTLFEALITNSVIDQLIHRSITKKADGLTCPFCGARHDPRKAKCVWEPKHWKSARGLADYLGKTMPFVDNFVVADVPGEDQLADYRSRRRTTA